MGIVGHIGGLIGIGGHKGGLIGIGRKVVRKDVSTKGTTLIKKKLLKVGFTSRTSQSKEGKRECPSKPLNHL